MTDEEIEQLREEMKAQREKIRADLAEKLGGSRRITTPEK